MLKFLVVALIATSGGVAQTSLKVATGRATIYYPGDGHCGKFKADGSRFRKKDSHIAHRTLPIGTSGALCNLRTGKCVSTTVRDRGPFGALRACRRGEPEDYSYANRTYSAKKIRWKRKCYYWQNQPGQLQQGFRYRGAFDLTRAVAKAIKHRPFDVVVFFYKKPKNDIKLAFR